MSLFTGIIVHFNLANYTTTKKNVKFINKAVYNRYLWIKP